jgi:chromosomal replication initiator protein
MAAPSIAAIQLAVSAAWGLDPSHLVAKWKAGPVVDARHVAMWLARRMTPLSLPAIGRLFGRRDHTTVLHAVRRIDQRMARDPHFADVVRGLAEQLSERTGDHANAAALH